MLLDLDFLNDMSHLILLITLIVSAGGTLAMVFSAGKSVKADVSFHHTWQKAVSDPKPYRFFTGGMDQLQIWIIRIMKMAAAPDDDGDRRFFSYESRALKIRGGHLCQTNHPCSHFLNDQVFSF
ncbi:hypothetical protein [Bacillus sp. FJAT-42376]|uniref:hypothetical protein n=1 Tax=Bacillus sp. FJAT-42376 TaxID=2014076 RepID=UPI000F4D4352|nr:hypothetical protein [Bacillus sp. FJAT-42376]